MVGEFLRNIVRSKLNFISMDQVIEKLFRTWLIWPGDEALLFRDFYLVNYLYDVLSLCVAIFSLQHFRRLSEFSLTLIIQENNF